MVVSWKPRMATLGTCWHATLWCATLTLVETSALAYPVWSLTMLSAWFLVFLWMWFVWLVTLSSILVVVVQMFRSCHREEEYWSTLLYLLCSLLDSTCTNSNRLFQNMPLLLLSKLCGDVLFKKNWVCWGCSTLVSRKIEASCVDRVVTKSRILSNILLTWRTEEW